MIDRFPAKTNSQGDLSKGFFPPISLFQLPGINASKNSSPNKRSCGSVFGAVLNDAIYLSYIGIGTNI